MAKKPIAVETLTHTAARRRNIPTAELQSLVAAEDAAPKQARYPRETPLPQGERRARNPDLDPQLVWRGKDEQDWSDLVVQAPPLYVQEKVKPQAIIADLLRQSRRRRGEAAGEQLSFYDDFNGLPDPEARLEFYQHDQNWSNRFILGDSLQVMASLAEKEGLCGQVQCIYFDPPYGIKFNSNFQWSTSSSKVTDGNPSHITREPEQIKAFRDTWRNGINSYLTYLRDRLTVARDLLSDSGSLFIQISNKNLHLVRGLLDEIFGQENFVSLITFVKTSGQTDNLLASVSDYIIWFAKDREKIKYHQLTKPKTLAGEGGSAYNSVRLIDGSSRRLTSEENLGVTRLPKDARVYRIDNLTSQSPGTRYTVEWRG